jgi:hypothetical protein
MLRCPCSLPPSPLQGSFAFVVYDSSTKRVWAARDAAGVQPLFWGVTGARAGPRAAHAPVQCMLLQCWARNMKHTSNRDVSRPCASAEDNRLVFGTDAEKLEGCNPTATPFPAGEPACEAAVLCATETLTTACGLRGCMPVC